MREYEVVFIIHPEVEETILNDVVEKVKGWITEANGTVDNVDLWGKRRLAYPIQKQREGYYVLLETKMDPSMNAELERNMQLLEPIMRYLITVVE